MSRKRRKARAIGLEAPRTQQTAQVIPMERPKAPTVKYSVAQIPIELLGSEALAREFFPFIKQACDLSRGRYTPEWVWSLAMHDEMQIWAWLRNGKPSGAFVTTTQLYPATGLHVVQIVMMGGKGLLGAAAQIREALIAFRDERKCHRIEWGGRPGFKRLWPGCEQIAVACEVA